MQAAILGPTVAMVTITAMVWVLAVGKRVGEIRARRIPVQSLARARDVGQILQDAQAMDNFNNLLQMPVLFYVLCLAVQVTAPASDGFLYAAWLYVVLRAAHSLIQVTYNRVLHRFYVWTASNVLLFGLWAGFAVGLVRTG